VIRRPTRVVVSVLVLSRVAAATEAVFPGPPVTIDDAETVEPKHLELNLTTSYSVRRAGWEGELLRVDANYGVLENVHVNVEVPFVVALDDDTHRRGFGTGSLALKLRLVHTETVQFTFHPALALAPFANVSADPQGETSFTLPAVLDLALGHEGAGLGLQLSRSFARTAADDTWGAAIGFASPVGDRASVMLDYAHTATPELRLRDGWFEAAFLRARLFGSEHLTLLTALGYSVYNHGMALVGVRVWL